MLFAFNSAAPRGRARGRIDQAEGAIRRASPGTVRVEGYTDSKGSPGFNVGLSRRRAAAVEGVRSRKLGAGRTLETSAIGRGEANPVAANTNRDGSTRPRAARSTAASRS